MRKNKSIIAVIPARGNSRGVTQKNLRLLAGKPLIWYVVDCALKSSSLDSVIVSTDSEEIADYVSSLSKNLVVYLHPKELSLDDSPTFPVIQRALRKFQNEVSEVELCVTLRATSPLRTTEDVNKAIEILVDHTEADSLVSICEAIGIHPIRLKRINKKGFLEDAFESEGNSPIQRQKLDKLFVRNGAIYITESNIIETLGLWGQNCFPYIMPQERSININTEFEMKIAELLLSGIKN